MTAPRSFWRRTARRAWGAAIATLVTAVSTTAHASPWAIGWQAAIQPELPPEDTARREAAAAFADGEAAFDRGEYSLAASRFARAHVLAPHRWTLHNLALSRARAGDAPGAWEAFDELARSATNEAERVEAERERAALARLVARIELRGPVGANACVDGRPVVIDGDGVVQRTVRPGVHRIATVDRVEVRAIAGGSSATFSLEQAQPRDRARPWLITGVIAAAAATGVAAAAAATTDEPRTRGLAAAAAGTAAVATSTVLVGLIVRERRAARPRPAPSLDCRAPSPAPG